MTNVNHHQSDMSILSKKGLISIADFVRFIKKQLQILFPRRPPKAAITSFDTTPGSCAGVGGQAKVLMTLMVHEKKYVLHELWSVK